MEVTRRRGKRHKKLLDDLKDRRGYSHLKEEALDRTMWRNLFRGGFGPVARQNTECMCECLYLHARIYELPLFVTVPKIHFAFWPFFCITLTPTTEFYT